MTGWLAPAGIPVLVRGFGSQPYADVVHDRVTADPRGAVLLVVLPTALPKATDRRSFSGSATTLAKALPPDVLATLVRQAVEAHRDPAVHQRALEREEAERHSVRDRLNGQE
ncbi:hypothetical protein [Streptomyces bauhiniae]|uniref:hypothetical protein n=1 Tax=Streptomyces bauhiniae TaxID=2340725 RepID=UPI00380E9B0E